MPTQRVYATTASSSYGWDGIERVTGVPDGNYARALGAAYGNVSASWMAGQTVRIVALAVGARIYHDFGAATRCWLNEVEVSVPVGQTLDVAVSVPPPPGVGTSWMFASSISTDGAGYSVDSVWWDITYEPVTLKSVSEQITLAPTESRQVQRIEYKAVVDGAAIAASEATVAGLVVRPSDGVALATEEYIGSTRAIIDAATLGVVEAAAATYTTALSDLVSLVTAESVRAGPAAAAWTTRELRAELLLVDGSVRSVPVLAAWYRLELGRIGVGEVEVPAAALPAAAVRELRLIRQGEGMVWRGIVVAIERGVDPSGAVRATLRAAGLARELAERAVISYSATEAPLSSIVAALLAGTGWTAGTLPTATVSVELRGVPRWTALAQLAERLGCQAREDPLARRLDLVRGAQPSGLIATTDPIPYEPSPASTRLPILELELEDAQDDIVTRLVPYGESVEGRQASLAYTTRTSPYSVQAATAEDGVTTYYYLADAAAEAQYGIRLAVVTWRGIGPRDDSDAEKVRAANELYDASVAYLQQRIAPRKVLRLTVAPTWHVDDGAYKLLPGQTIRVRARTLFRRATDVLTTLDLDDDLYVVAFERRFEQSGADRWVLTVSDSQRPLPDEVDAIAQAVDLVQTTVLGAPGSGGGGSSGGGAVPARQLADAIIEAMSIGSWGTPWW